MVKINKSLNTTSCQLWHRDHGFIGTCDCNEQIADVRLQINKGDLTGYYFIFNGQRLDISENGSCSHYPRGFCDHHFAIMDEMLLTGARKRKAREVREYNKENI